MYEQLFNWIEVHFNIFGSVVLFVLIMGTIILSNIKAEDKKRNVLRGCTIGYIFLLYMLTLGGRVKGNETNLILELRGMKAGVGKIQFQELIWGDFANFLLFMPYGILLCAYKKKGLVTCVCSATWLSAIVEGLQLILKRGYCDINDLIWNVLGSVFGYGLCGIICNRVKKSE